MTIPEAVQLVLQAAALGKGGEVFVLDMGEPIKIVDLARDLIRLSGLEEGQDIDIVFTGLRPGEKMFEELFVSGEDYARTGHEKIFVARSGAEEIQNPALSRSPERSEGAAEGSKFKIQNPQYAIHDPPSAICNLQSNVDALIAAAHGGDAAGVRRWLQTIAPEYRPAESVEAAPPHPFLMFFPAPNGVGRKNQETGGRRGKTCRSSSPHLKAGASGRQGR